MLFINFFHEIIFNSKLYVSDKDKGPPNTVVNIATDNKCPLEPEDTQVTSKKGEEEPVRMKLRQHLDYDNSDTHTMTCIITLEVMVYFLYWKFAK